MNYYDQNAETFIENTLTINMGTLYKTFEKRIKPGGSILDVGCGPGRDLKYFKSRGYDPMGLEPSFPLARYAREYSACEVIETTIQDFDTAEQFSGIWACASLLHLATPELIPALDKLAGMLKDEGIFYCSFKYSDFEGERAGRFFNDQTLTSFTDLLTEKLWIKKSWFTEDQRPDNQQIWLNLLLTKTE
ncbi:class I SAM-dependent methyltransferase [bacterium]|nr:class I SAM-dependent methyltransferase [bacterium]